MVEPALNLIDGHCRRLVGIEVALLLDVGEGRTGQQMDFTHYGADPPLDMAAIVGRAHRSIVDRDPILLTAALQSLGPELLGVVEMQTFRDATNWPLCFDIALGEPAILHFKAPPAKSHHAAAHVDCEDDPASRHTYLRRTTAKRTCIMIHD